MSEHDIHETGDGSLFFEKSLFTLSISWCFSYNKCILNSLQNIKIDTTYWIKDQHPAKEMNSFMCSLARQGIKYRKRWLWKNKEFEYVNEYKRYWVWLIYDTVSTQLKKCMHVSQNSKGMNISLINQSLKTTTVIDFQ